MQQQLENTAPPMETGQIAMAVVQHKSRVAFAAYDEHRNTIILEECVSAAFDSNEYVEPVIAAIKPTLILIPSKLAADADLLDALTTPAPNPEEGRRHDGDDDDDDGSRQQNATFGRSTPYRVMKTSTFDVRTCQSNILKLRVGSLLRQGAATLGPANQPHRTFGGSAADHTAFYVSSFHALASMIDFDSVAQVQAIGCLLAFLQSSTLRFDDRGPMHVDDIVYAEASMHMAISAETLSALHIFNTEHHPLNVAKGTGSSKEGFSLFSLLDRTKSRAGRELLREWMLQPLVDVDAISMRQDGVELFTLAEFRSAGETILDLFSSIGSVERIVARIQKCNAKPSDFLILSKALSAAVGIIDNLQEEILWKLRQRAEPVQLLPETMDHDAWQANPREERYMLFLEHLLEQCHTDALQQLWEQIKNTIDEEATFECKAVVIRPGHNPDLDRYKSLFVQLGDTLTDAAGGLIELYPHLDGILEVIFLPQLGFLVGLDDELDLNEAGVLPDDFEFLFKESNQLFYKCTEVRSLDENIGDLDTLIKDMEAMVVTKLEERILDHQAELAESFLALAELDCILAFADCSMDLGYVRPNVAPAEQNCIVIRKGRHPLQEIIIDTDFVPNDTAIDPTNRVNVITGPNFSGKSCYARQVGVFVFMTQIGCFVPCEEATVSVVDQILARFSSVETCSVPQSSFQLDLTQMGSILRKASSNSLVIVDEFGKGTSPASGISLLASSLQHLSTKRCKVVCTTHFLEIFSMGLVQDGLDGIKALQMKVKIPETSQDDAVPLFTLMEGIAESSAGLVCARMAGVKEAVIERATEIVQAVRERRKLQPMVEILRGELDLSDLEKEVLDWFLRTDWKSASDEEIEQFLMKVSVM